MAASESSYPNGFLMSRWADKLSGSVSSPWTVSGGLMPSQRQVCHFRSGEVSTRCFQRLETRRASLSRVAQSRCWRTCSRSSDVFRTVEMALTLGVVEIDMIQGLAASSE
ncbi:hypothetical protein AA313_de0202150 [Arthrobotrys entomopaga]|nr:hypothetical protein AA313_de0202150 [Arthrobotrys entomopaga]